MSGGGAWNPWRSLRARPDIRFALGELPDGVNGAYARRGDARAIVINRKIGRRDRKATLGHELIHDELGGGCEYDGMPDGWVPVCKRHEHRVQLEVARRLVPPEDLEELRRVHEQENFLPPLTAVDVGEIFDVPLDVAETAMQLLVSP